MKRLVLSLGLVGSLMAAGLHNRNQVRGDYIEARTADVYTGACFANSEVDLVGNLAVFGWRVDQGVFDGVKLDGLSVVGVVKAANTLGNIHAEAYPVKSVVIVDEKATPAQRLALKAFAQRMGGDLLQDIVKVEYQPISLSFDGNNMHSAKATLKAGDLEGARRALEQSLRNALEEAAKQGEDAPGDIYNAGVAVSEETLLAYQETVGDQRFFCQFEVAPVGVGGALAVIRIDPRLVRASITGVGADGPYAGRPAYDSVPLGLSGLSSLLFWWRLQ